jgi:SSS family solute:Na+ symporter
MALRFGDLLAIILFVAGMLWLGWWSQRRIKGTEGYFVGNRSLPGWAVGMSVLATAISSITFLAYPGNSYQGNWSRLVPGMMLPVAALIGVYFFVVFYRRTLFVSAYQYFERRFGNWGRSYASVLFSLGSLYRMGMVLYLMSIPITVMVGGNILTIIFCAGIIVTIYTVMGGLEAVIWTDVVQGIVLIAGGLITVAIAFIDVPGGANEIITRASAAGKFDMAVSFDWSFAKETIWIFILMGLVGNIQELSTDQTKVQRYQAAKSDKAAIGATLTVLACIPVWILFMFIGTCLWAYYTDFPALLPAGIKADYIYPHFILTQMPTFVAGMVISAVLAAAMSTIDSSMNGSAAVLLEDFYKRHLAPGHDDTHYLKVARYITIALGCLMMVIAWALTILDASTILDVGFFIGAVMAGGLGGFFLLGFLFKHANERGAMVGVIAGVVAILWCTLSNLNAHLGILPTWAVIEIHPYMIGVVGNAVIFVVGVIASFFFPRPTEEQLAGMTWWTRDKRSEKDALAARKNT